MKGLLPIPAAGAPRPSRRPGGSLGPALAAAGFLLLAAGGARADDAAGPPLDHGWYLARGACPFECCVYRTWRATKATRLHAAPRAAQIVGDVAAGEAVLATTGVVYARPVPVEVIHDHADSNGLALRQGQRFYLLDYLGEGIHRIWLDGEERHLDALDLYRIEPDSYRTDVTRFGSCDAPSPTCWWRIAPELQHQDTEWWVELRTTGGAEGWSGEPDNFADKDACG